MSPYSTFAIIFFLATLVSAGEQSFGIQTTGVVATITKGPNNLVTCTIVYTTDKKSNKVDYQFKIPKKSPLQDVDDSTTQSQTGLGPQTLTFTLPVCTSESGPGIAFCYGEIRDGNGNILAKDNKTLEILCGKGERDPKFVGFHGETFYVKGEDGHNYAIISDKHVQVNALFDRHGQFYQHQTFMKQIGMLVGSHYKILFSVNGTITVNGIEFTCKELESRNVNTEQLKITCIPESDRKFKFVVTVADYELGFNSKLNGIMINLDAAFHPSSNNYMVHGILGQTADKDRTARQGLPGSQQGEGVIEGTYKDYEVSHIFGTNFKFNRFIGLDRPIIY